MHSPGPAPLHLPQQGADGLQGVTEDLFLDSDADGDGKLSLEDWYTARSWAQSELVGGGAQRRREEAQAACCDWCVCD